MVNEFSINDRILGILRHQNPDSVPVKIRLTDEYVFLYVGARDWQWSRKDGHLIGCGTGMCQPIADEA